ncbi:uncharacterized protein F5147DRAFT_287566 [Suillus discolor]|uniref:Uncharacterized protein n=1 Tax=Suillus discolor TaxID=1912936 RepID=A0A9P7JRQ6_9AGAM|nr:uncharacterized protein F5147DRAFT_287566 [Suillus discolor]KAG2102855.1 hypothetical protein F5147DRAFT_287566 [Suillus discolor]
MVTPLVVCFVLPLYLELIFASLVMGQGPRSMAFPRPLGPPTGARCSQYCWHDFSIDSKLLMNDCQSITISYTCQVVWGEDSEVESTCPLLEVPGMRRI